jgi:hypothetical protein
LGSVEGVEVLVVEARPLAELAVPRLERLGGLRVVDELVDPRADLVIFSKSGAPSSPGEVSGVM